MRRPLAVAAALLVAAAAAQAYIPQASRVLAAVARHNKTVGRAQSLRFEVSMRIVGAGPGAAGTAADASADGAGASPGDVIGRGVLVTHPSGLARLELRGAGGLVERHVLQAGEHLAVRNGELLASPREFLPPLFLLQTDSTLALRAGLESIGAEVDAIGLAPCGEGDCYVLGDPRRVPPPRELPEPPEDDPDDAGDGLADVAASPFGDDMPVRDVMTADPLLADGPRAALWVDLASFEPRRIDLPTGVVVWLGPVANFGRLSAPAWYQVDEPGKPSVRFDVVGASAVDAPAAAFSRSWLESPIVPATPGAGVAPGDAEAPSDTR
ncbi:MAG: hypothetical protein R3E88_21915 [Myxococcota bacterium]